MAPVWRSVPNTRKHVSHGPRRTSKTSGTATWTWTRSDSTSPAATGASKSLWVRRVRRRGSSRRDSWGRSWSSQRSLDHHGATSMASSGAGGWRSLSSTSAQLPCTGNYRSIACMYILVCSPFKKKSFSQRASVCW